MLRGNGKQERFQWYKQAELNDTTETDGWRERETGAISNLSPACDAVDCLCGMNKLLREAIDC